jgi:hypothetical protein
MQDNAENKMMNAADPQDEVTSKAVLYDFFFPGSGKWKPKTVRAETREEAQQIWEANREPAQPEEERSVSETNNE